jgi:3'(2'), 5'-bisphosphate nucleotidase
MKVNNEQLQTLCAIADAAGHEIMAVYASGGKTWQKADDSPLTDKIKGQN